MLTAKPKSSRQIKNLAAKAKSSRQNKKLTAKAKSSRQKQKLTAKAKAHGKSKNTRGKSKKLTAKAKSSRQNQNQRKGSWALIVHAKAAGDKSNMATSSSLSSQMFCSNCGAEAVPTANICTRCGQGNMLQVYFVYTRMGELMNTR